MTSDSTAGSRRMLDACRLREVDATPVWFMRQAGRCFQEYRDLRKKYEILTIAKTPELCAQVTLLPVDRLGVDAAVMFADIMLPLEGMGIPFHIEPDTGPIIHDPIRTEAQIDAIRVIDAAEATPYLFDAIRLIHRQLDGRAALVGFSGSPFTLACYMIEGRPSRAYDKAKGLMLARPDLWATLMEKTTQVVVRYLREQVAAGAEVIQIFDSWVGVLSPGQYETSVLPYVTRIFDALRETGVPSVHFGTGNASLLDLMRDAGSDIMSLDWRVDLDTAWARIGYDKGVQGNLDPVLLLAPWETIRDGVRDVLRRADGRPGHVFNLGHGVLPDTNPDDLKRIVDLVHEESRR